ncbi:MAG: HAMP domain-containing sensor histidine kinase [Bacteroidales bacterium]|jgi:two-component system phosphate regulon sensor histidine kinase PhoR
MNKPLKSTVLIILVVIFLPTIIFSIYELGSLRSNEKVIEAIYQNQLDAILYSVNQYSEDIISSWANKLELIFRKKQGNEPDNLRKFLDETPSAKQFMQFNETGLPEVHFPLQTNNNYLDTIQQLLFAENDTTLKKLQTYLRGGYRKIESFVLNDSSGQLIVFAFEHENKILFNAIVFDPQKFISEVLDPKIQEIAQNEFFITAQRQNSDSILYSSDKQTSLSEITHKKAFWLLPQYTMGIELKNQTISSLVKSRSRKDLLLILIVDFGLILGIWLIFRNVRKQLELSQLKSDFVSNVSHEIRTPLALISMYIETLELGRIKSKDKVKEYYNIILHETQRLTGIVNKILNFSQIESGKKVYKFSSANINDIVREVANTFKYGLESKGFQYSVNCSSKLPEVQVDAEAVTDALVNIIDNATKYSLTNKQIDISTGLNKAWVYIEVADKGIGISEKELNHIFEKFYRVTEKNLALKAKGSGLGLTIVKHIMDSHGGKIEVKSKKDAGTAFRLLFPVK